MTLTCSETERETIESTHACEQLKGWHSETIVIKLDVKKASKFTMDLLFCMAWKLFFCFTSRATLTYVHTLNNYDIFPIVYCALKLCRKIVYAVEIISLARYVVIIPFFYRLWYFTMTIILSSLKKCDRCESFSGTSRGATAPVINILNTLWLLYGFFSFSIDWTLQTFSFTLVWKKLWQFQ